MACARCQTLRFKDFVTRTSERVKESAYGEAARRDRPIRYLESSGWDKEKIAKRVLAEQPIDRGLICVLTAVEPCLSFEYHRSPDREERGLKLRPKKCLHLYKYFVHPQLGFMSANCFPWLGNIWAAPRRRRREFRVKSRGSLNSRLSTLNFAVRHSSTPSLAQSSSAIAVSAPCA